MNLKNKKILVTGGAGFVGSHLVDALLKKNAHVSVLDNLSAGYIENLKQVKKDIAFHKQDIRNYDKLHQIIKKQDIVFHLAANADVPRSEREPDYEFENNVLGSYNVLKSCLQSHTQKIIFASSAAVYGEPMYLPLDENHPLNPTSLYGVSKMYAEKIGFSYYKNYGLPFTAIRIFNNYGERQSKFVMFDLLKKIYKKTDVLHVMGTGEQVRDYCYVLDGVQCFIKAAENDTSTGEAFNLAGGSPIKIKDLVTLLIDITGLKKNKVIYSGKSWPGDIKQLVGDTTKSKNILGFQATIGLSEGLKMLDTWLRVRQK